MLSCISSSRSSSNQKAMALHMPDCCTGSCMHICTDKSCLNNAYIGNVGPLLYIAATLQGCHITQAWIERLVYTPVVRTLVYTLSVIAC